MALALHQINLGLRFGAFWFNPENGTVGFQMPGVISEGGDLQPQISAWVGTALSTFDAHLRALTLIAGSTKQARQQVRKLTAKSRGGAEEQTVGLPKSRRPELN